MGSAAISATAPDPVVGTWKLNLAKSAFKAGPTLKSQTRIYSQSPQGITLSMKTVGADGKEIDSQTTYHLDGKEYPVTGSPDYDSLAGKQVDSNTAEFKLMRSGKAVGTTRRTVSKDGKMLTVDLKVTDAKGEKAEDVTVFDKQ
jgi:2',3'-cyclic-nucleotide 2'-phosphodiesterase (5'-nucleotidase family)